MRNLVTVRSLLSFVVGILLGAIIWWVSPYFTGESEAWDAMPFYLPSLFIAGIIASSPCPRHFWISSLGIYIGQCLYAYLFLPSGPLWVVGLILGVGYLLYPLAGGTIVYMLWKNTRRRKKHLKKEASRKSEQ